MVAILIIIPDLQRRATTVPLKDAGDPLTYLLLMVMVKVYPMDPSSVGE